MLLVVANVYSTIHANLQGQNLHQSPACRIRANRQRPAPAHHLLAGKPGTRPGRRLAGTGAQAPIGVAGTRVLVGFFDRNPRMGGESSQQKEDHRRIRPNPFALPPPTPPAPDRTTPHTLPRT